MPEFKITRAVSMRAYQTEWIEADNITAAVEQAKAEPFDNFTFDLNNPEIDGDEILYVDQEDGEEVIVDMAEEGEPYSFLATCFVQDLAKRELTGDGSDLDKIIGEAKRLCTRTPQGMQEG